MEILNKNPRTRDARLIDDNEALWPVSENMLAEEEYRIAKNDIAQAHYDYYMSRFDSNLNDLTNNWQDIAIALGKQIQIDLRDGHIMDEIMPTKATTSGAHAETDKRPRQIYEAVASSRQSAVVGHFMNMIEFLILTSEHGVEIDAWYKDKDPAYKNERHLLPSPGFNIG